MDQTNLVKFDKLKADITAYVEPTKNIVVNSQDTQAGAMTSVREIKSWQKKVEEVRDSLVRPLNEQVRLINSYAKEISDPLGRAETHIKTQLTYWERELAKKRAEEAARIERERQAKEEELRKKLAEEKAQVKEIGNQLYSESPIETAKAVAQVETQAIKEKFKLEQETRAEMKAVDNMKVSGAKKVWKFDVLDPDLVPRKYCSVEQKLIRSAIAQGVREIPGLKIYEDISIAIR